MAGAEGRFYVAYPSKCEVHLFHLMLSRHPEGLHDYLLESNDLFKISTELNRYNFSSKLLTGGHVFCSPMHFTQAVEMAETVIARGVPLQNCDIVVDAALMGFLQEKLRTARKDLKSNGQVKIRRSTYLGTARGV